MTWLYIFICFHAVMQWLVVYRFLALSMHDARGCGVWVPPPPKWETKITFKIVVFSTFKIVNVSFSPAASIAARAIFKINLKISIAARANFKINLLQILNFRGTNAKQI